MFNVLLSVIASRSLRPHSLCRRQPCFITLERTDVSNRLRAIAAICKHYCDIHPCLNIAPYGRTSNGHRDEPHRKIMGRKLGNFHVNGLIYRFIDLF